MKQRITRSRFAGVFASVLLVIMMPYAANAQTVIATVNVGAISQYGSETLAVNPATHTIYVPTAGGFSVIDGATNSVTTYPLTNAAGPAAVNPATGNVYIGTLGVVRVDNQSFPKGGIDMIDGSTDSSTVLACECGISAFGMAVNVATNQVYVAGDHDQVINGATNAVGGLPEGSLGVDLDPVTNRVYFATSPGSITVVDGNTGTVAATLSAGNTPRFVAVNPITHKIYVTNEASNTVTLVDGVTLATTTIPVGGFPQQIAVNPVTNKIYVANRNSENITVIDGATNATTTLTDPTALGPFGVAVDALTDQIYVTNIGSATVTVIDGATNALTTVTLPNASLTGPIALDPLTNTVYALNEGSNSVSVIAGVAGTGTTDFAMSASSTSLMLLPGGQATDTIIVGPPYGNTVDFLCSVSGPSPAPACELSASSVTPGPTYGTATLTITAPTAAAMLAPSHHPRLGGFYAACVPLLFGITVLGSSRRRRTWLSAGFLPVFLILLSSCGGSQNGGGGTGPQNYTVTVTGTSGTIQHSMQVTVTVQ